MENPILSYLRMTFQEIDEFLAQAENQSLAKLQEAINSIESGNKRLDFEAEIDGRKYLIKVYRVKENLIRIDLLTPKWTEKIY